MMEPIASAARSLTRRGSSGNGAGLVRGPSASTGQFPIGASGPQPTLSRAKFASKRHGNLGSQQQSKGETVGYEQKRHVGSQDKITGT